MCIRDRALAADPEIILMDEPFGALDPITRSSLQDELLQMQDKLGKTIVFVTHDMDEALKLADKIVIMKDGKVLQFDSPEHILKNPANEFVEDVYKRQEFLLQTLQLARCQRTTPVQLRFECIHA